MKRMAKVEEVELEGLDILMGKTVTLFCAVYIYEGTLVGVNDTCVKLEKAHIVYETGPLSGAERKDKQPMPGDWYVARGAIESFGQLK